LLGLRHRQAPHTYGGYWVCGQSLAITLLQFMQTELRGGQSTVSQDASWLRIIDQDMCSGDAVALMLSGALTQIIVQRGDSARESVAVMVGNIQDSDSERHTSAPL